MPTEDRLARPRMTIPMLLFGVLGAMMLANGAATGQWQFLVAGVLLAGVIAPLVAIRRYLATQEIYRFWAPTVGAWSAVAVALIVGAAICLAQLP